VKEREDLVIVGRTNLAMTRFEKHLKLIKGKLEVILKVL
jgi:hypothetical protein